MEYIIMEHIIMNQNLEKMEQIFLKYLPNKPYQLTHTYIYDWLILGNLNDALTLNTDAVLSVFNEGEQYKELFSKKKWLNIYAVDNSEQNLEEHFNKAFEFLDQMEKEKKVCIVHCHAGINRSATIVLAYFMKKTNTKLFDAYEHFISQRKGIIYNIGFRKQLIKWATVNNLI